MRRIKIYCVITVFSLLIASCNPATPTNQPEFIPTIFLEGNPTFAQEGLPRTEAEVPRVSVEETLAALQSGEAVVVDVRSIESYQGSHIPEALSIPLAQIETDPAGLNLDEDQWIITYCT